MAVPVAIQNLAGRVPWPPAEDRVAGATGDRIARAEAILRQAVPLEWRQLLEWMNGGCIGPGGVFGIFPSRPALDAFRILADYPRWREKRWIPVAGA